MASIELMTALVWLYAVSGLVTNLLYLPQLALLWRSPEARRALSFTAWAGWALLDIVALVHAILVVPDQPEMAIVAAVNLVAQGTVVCFIGYELVRQWATGPSPSIPTTVAPARPADAAVILRKSAQRPFLYVAPAAGKGHGLHAARAFQPGETLVLDDDGTYYEATLSATEAAALGLDLVQSCFQIGPDRYVPAPGVIDDYINHACEPNAGIRLTTAGYELVALRPIAAHEEVSYDYSTYISREGREVLTCACGSRHCRGRISAFVELPPERQQRYLEAAVVGPFILAELAARPRPSSAQDLDMAAGAALPA